MSEVNVLKVCMNYFERTGRDSVDGRVRRSAPSAVSEHELNTDRIKLKVTGVNWENMTQQNTNIERKIKICKDPTLNSQGQIQVTGEPDFRYKVTIDSGFIKGINKKLKLNLRGTTSEVIEKFGEHLKIDPSKVEQKQEVQGVVKRKDIPSTGAVCTTATFCSKRKEYVGRFECTVVITGLVILRHQTLAERQFSTVVSNSKGFDDVDALSINDQGEVEIKMTGQVELHWDHKIE